jgi:hypothetical protein
VAHRHGFLSELMRAKKVKGRGRTQLSRQVDYGRCCIETNRYRGVYGIPQRCAQLHDAGTCEFTPHAQHWAA